VPRAAQVTPHTTLDESTVSAIAWKTHTPVAVVKHLYEEELADLESNSAVKGFLDVIAGRRVKERLRQPRYQRTKHADQASPRS
jgi:hypothetical protein